VSTPTNAPRTREEGSFLDWVPVVSARTLCLEVGSRHRSDRTEIQNPGGLYGDLTPEQFPGGTSYLNPILAEAAKVLGFVNRFGRGISGAEREFQRNGSPPAQFDPRSHFFLVMVGRRP
jgi:ATP-dependent DNA helicase RecG